MQNDTWSAPTPQSLGGLPSGVTPLSVASVNPRDLRRLLVAGSAIAAIGLGVRSTFGLFLNDINAALDADTATFALAIAIQNLVWGLGQPVAGSIADRFGSARVLAVGALLYSGGVVLMATAQSPAQLYLSGGFVVGVGLAATSFSVVLASIGRRYPPERRSKALGIATAVGSGGQFVFVQFANRIEAASDWQTALVALGITTLAIAVLARPLSGNAASTDTSSTDTTSTGDGAAPAATPANETAETLGAAIGRATANRSYLLLCAGFFVCGVHVTFIATHLIPFLEAGAVSDSVAGLAWALVGLTNIGGSYLAGVLGTRHSKPRLLALIYGARGVVIAAFVLAPISDVTVIGFGALIGVLWLSTVPLTGAIVAQQFGTRHSGTLFGIVFLAHQLGAFAGAYGGGWLADRTGDYAASWWVAVALAVGAAAVSLCIDEGPQPLEPARRRGPIVRVARPAAGLGAIALFATLSLTTTPTSAAAADAASARAFDRPAIICLLPHPDAGN